MASQAGIEHAIERAARRYRISPSILRRQLVQESNLDPNARSSAGASGVAQFIASTAKQYGVNLNDGRVTDDIMGAAHYDRDNLDANGGDWRKALSAYNSGRPDAYKDPNFAGGQTYNYVKKILGGGNPRAASGSLSTSGSGTPIGMTLQHGTEQIDQTDPALVRKQFFAQWLAKKDPNSLLLKLGAVDPNMSTTSPVSIPTVSGFKVTGGGSGSPAATGAGPRRAVAEAAKRIGVSEQGANNRGPRIDSWEKKFGMLGQAWCGIFVGLSLEKAGVKGLNAGVASVSQIEKDARAGRNGFARFLPASQARPGDALITRAGGHVGLVERVDRDGTIHTIEGNTGNGSVLRRTHKASDVYGAARPRY